MKRRLLNTLALLSLLLCVATVMLWWRSYEYPLAVTRTTSFPKTVAFDTAHVASQRGFIEVSWMTEAWFRQVKSKPDGTWWIVRTREQWIVAQTDTQHFAGLGASRRYDQVTIMVAWLWLTLLFAALPAVRGRAIWCKHKRTKLGLCLTCGYDLRQSPDRCPECGEVRAGSQIDN